METPLTEHIRPGHPSPDLAAYQKLGGYQALRRALTEMTPTEVIEAVKDSNLRGRGGAGFPAGLKWSLVPSGDDAPRQRYLVCNADEMEPGTFKDRYLIEGNPHQLLEGIMLAAYAIKADTAYIFLRAEYTCSERTLREAIAELFAENLLGDNILGSNYNLNIHLHTSAGRYICGEETALLNALEGKRAVPRAKPPFPPQVGLWGQPTIVQNVETLCCVPHIINHGADWFKGLSKTNNSGTKIYGVSGRVKRPGLWELPLGTTLREIIEEHAGGMLDGYKFRGVIPGGASTDFLVEEHLDLPLDYETVAAAGSRLGTGTMIVLDDRTCPIAMVHNLETFFARESCGWCTPCRDGLPWIEKTLSAIEEGRGVASDIDLLHQHSRMLGPGRTFCAFAPGAVEPLQSALKYFADDFEQHISEKRCPYKHLQS
ncbi:NADH-quinone oxidoreductase subunit NuoF [Rubritalea profundi]|uniref:NADH-quinone oxidoreductase subunit NuoF n=1 Tax=Rubritalea profundi TaxID=1658618 RepID=UPI00197E00A1|nr:NADH-quinone oxidoreductase subunit NuoF [Rubritalea profundi]